MISGEIVVSLVSILIASLALVQSASFPGGSSDGVPGAGFFPQAVCIGIILLGAIIAVQGIRQKNRAKVFLWDEQGRKNIMSAGMVFGSLLLFALLFGHVPFVANCFVFLMLLGLIFKQKLKIYTPTVLGVSALLYFIFEKLLQVMLDG